MHRLVQYSTLCKEDNLLKSFYLVPAGRQSPSCSVKTGKEIVYLADDFSCECFGYVFNADSNVLLHTCSLFSLISLKFRKRNNKRLRFRGAWEEGELQEKFERRLKSLLSRSQFLLFQTWANNGSVILFAQGS